MQSIVLTGATSCTLTLANLPDRLPLYTRGTAAGKIVATDISLAVTVTSRHLDGADVTVAQADGSSFTDGPAIGDLQQFVREGASVPAATSAFIINNVKAVVGQMWLMIRYTIT